MKGGVACQRATLFKYSNNSCYLDTTLIGWLHFADADLKAALEELGATEPQGNKKRLIEKLIEIYDSLKLYGPAKDVTKLREEFRNILQKCDDFINLMPEPNLKSTQAADEIFTSLTEYIGINNIKIKNNYRGFRGYTEEEKNNLMAQNPDRNRNQLNTFNPDLPVPPPREPIIENINISILKPAEGSLSPQELVSTPLESRRDGDYIVDQTINGTVYGILPISVERRLYDKYNDTKRNKTPINLESHLELDDGLYALVSIICFVSNPSHYVGYYKCDEGDNWIFYNDLGIDLDKMVGGGGTKCEQDINKIFETWLEGYLEIISEKSEEFESELIEIIVESEDIITDSLRTELLPEIIEECCQKNNYNVKNIFKIWWDSVKKRVKNQWDEIKNTVSYKGLKTKKSKERSSEQQEIYNKFKKFEDSRKIIVNQLIELIRSNKGNKQAEKTSTMPTRTRDDKTLYIDMGPIENWENSNLPGYNNTPKEASTLLFYKKIDNEREGQEDQEEVNANIARRLERENYYTGDAKQEEADERFARKLIEENAAQEAKEEEDAALARSLAEEP